MFKPGDYSAHRSAGVSGLGDLLYDTQRGIFGEEVAGGGIFSNAIDGLGSLASLGADFAADSQACMSYCNMATVANPSESPICFSNCLAARSKGSQYTFAPKTDTAAAKAFQETVNRAIAKLGYCPIATDGKIGPNTCIAATAAGLAHPLCAGKSGGTLPPKKPNCGGTTGGGGGVVAPPVLPTTSAGMSTQTKALLAGGVAAIALIYYLKKRKKG